MAIHIYETPLSRVVPGLAFEVVLDANIKVVEDLIHGAPHHLGAMRIVRDLIMAMTAKMPKAAVTTISMAKCFAQIACAGSDGLLHPGAMQGMERG